jgi:hypothetical protein
MAAGSASRTLRSPGRLVAGPTNLSLSYPYGGTEVGRAKLVVLTSLGQSFRVNCEGLGGEPSDILGSPSYYVFSCFLRGWDDDAVELFFQNNYVQGAVSGHSMIREPSNRVGGSSEYSRATSLLYVPDDPINSPAVMIYAGIPDFSDGAEVVFQRGEELGIALAVECVRGPTGKILEVGRLVDLSLT